ncbi:NAD(P)/FAD-dependent oxidoreductase [Acholeplasma granularum]|uniref:NAD(P)/FAD-dependent oxidoreductase n=1 Tax=Acholeplasma granularum TaxID=264635 RepID=UPI00046F6A6F|nr:NAD(P)/FAD-dependent oxidoreductase [Acholeplasma granularum]
MLEVLIIGAGPTGLYAAFLAGLRNLKSAIIESSGEVGGQLTAVYKDKFIYDIPGFPKVKAKDYIDGLVLQYERFKNEIPIYYNEEAIDIKRNDDHFIVTTSTKKIETKFILIAHGGGGFVPQKLKVENHYDNVLYFINDLSKFKNKNIVVLGGGDSALDWATDISEYTNNVTLIHRRDEFRALQSTVDEFKTKGKILTPYIVEDLIGESNLASKLVLKHAKTHEKLIIEADYIIVNYGFVLTKSRLTEWEIEGEKGLINVDYTMETNQKGIYAAGNGINYPGKVKLISTGQGEAATAIQSITTLLYPEKTRKFEHSSTLIKE